MSLAMLKKKRYKFHVDLQLEELNAVTFLNGILFAKLRLLEGGRFSQYSTREEVHQHAVKWAASFSFVCKMSANAWTGTLDQCRLRISVRKELKGGRSFLKLGFVDLNLAELAGSGQTCRRCLLEGYSSRHRQDNSMIKINVAVTLLSGDPCFKVPSPRTISSFGIEAADDSSSNSPDIRNYLNLAALLERNEARYYIGLTDQLVTASPSSSSNSSTSSCTPSEAPLARGYHRRHLSTVSYTGSSLSSSASGCESLSSPSLVSLQSAGCRRELGHVRKSSHSSVFSDCGIEDRIVYKQLHVLPAKQESRFNATRVNPDQLIDELISAADIGRDDSAESTGLQLYMFRQQDVRSMKR